MTNTDEWFVAVLLLQAEHRDEPNYGDKLYEKRVVLFRGHDEGEVERKANAYCSAMPETYRNEYGQRIAWRCRRVLGVLPLYTTDLHEGDEVYWELVEGDPENSLGSSLGGTTTVTARAMDAAREAAHHYRNALRRLAE